MKAYQIAGLIIFILILGFSIWYLTFKNSVLKIKNKITEYIAVIDVALAIKYDFLMRLAKLIYLKETDIPKEVKNAPRAIWSHLERELYIEKIKEFEENIETHLSKTRRKIDQEQKEDLLNKIEDTTERINSYIFVYNNNVATYNYKVATKQAKFFLKKEKFPYKEMFNVTYKIKNNEK